MAEELPSRRDKLLKEHEVVFHEARANVPVGHLTHRKGRSPRSDAAGEAEVKVTKSADGTVEQITVRCACGREITIQCEYSGRGDDNGERAS